MPLASALDTLHARVVRVPALQYFTALDRLLLAIGFIPPALKKILYLRFTTLPLSSPVGFFFEAFHRNELWYRTVGWAQLLAALLLLWPRTAALGAVLYLPIIANIALVTIGIGFAGTPVITVSMTLAALWLVCWEYDAWRGLMPWGRDATQRAPASAGSRRLAGAPPSPLPLGLTGSAAAWAVAALAAYVAALFLDLGGARRSPGLTGLPVLALGGALFGTAVALLARHTVRAPRHG